MKKYDEYKDSGVSWIGEIPKDWEVRRFRYSFNTRTGLTITRGELLENGVPCINYGEIHSKYGFDLDIERDVLKNAPVELLKNKSNALVDENDFIFCDTSEDIVGSGNNVYIKSTCDKNMFAGSHTIIAHPIIKVYARYLAYLFSTQEWRSQIRSRVYGVKVFSITQTILKDAGLILPPKEIQHSIADYLDRKTAAIDSLIEDKQKLVELLKEKRQAVISEAVTKGLDKNANMKDSGIEWIGEIPEGWEVKKISWLFNEISSGTTPKAEQGEFYNGDIPWLNTGDLTDGYIYSASKTVTIEALKKHSALKVYDENSLVVAMYGATIGKLGITTFPLCTNQACCVMSKPNGISIKYMFYCWLAIRSYLLSLAYGGGQPNISQSLIRQLKFPAPNIEIQHLIVNYVDQKTADIDSLTSDITAQIEKLKEYRQAIISEAVTGKVAI